MEKTKLSSIEKNVTKISEEIALMIKIMDTCDCRWISYFFSFFLDESLIINFTEVGDILNSVPVKDEVGNQFCGKEKISLF